jgi:hypothetical protein
MAFRRRVFTKVFFILKAAFNNPLLRFIYVYGGSSASKTYSVVQLLVYNMLRDPTETAMVLRKYSVDIDDTIYADFKDVLKRWGLTHLFKIQKHYIECRVTGAFVKFRGLDDSEKIKGISGFKRIILEEISQFDQSDLKQIRKRLRGKKGQQIIGIFNPITEEHWIKKEIFDKSGLKAPDTTTGMYIDAKGKLIDTSVAGLWENDLGNMLVIKTNYLDNPFIIGPHFRDQATIDDFEFDRLHDPEYYEVYGLGNWGKIRTGGEFWKDFKRSTCTTDLGWCPEQPIFQSWDENVNPYLTCLVWQLYSTARMELIRPWLEANGLGWVLTKKYLAVQIDEICLEDPRNRVRDVCQEFIKRYPVTRVNGLFVCGDRTSLKEDTKLEKGENFYTKIAEYLGDYHPRMRLQSKNPSIVQSAGFINECYARRTDVAVLINRKCEKSIWDYQYSPEDSDGTLKKVKATHPITKISYEKYGHPSDAKRYVITSNLGDEYTKYLRGGKAIPIRTGKNEHKHSH